MGSIIITHKIKSIIIISKCTVKWYIIRTVQAKYVFLKIWVEFLDWREALGALFRENLGTQIYPCNQCIWVVLRSDQIISFRIPSLRKISRSGSRNRIGKSVHGDSVFDNSVRCSNCKSFRVSIIFV